MPQPGYITIANIASTTPQKLSNEMRLTPLSEQRWHPAVSWLTTCLSLPNLLLLTAILITNQILIFCRTVGGGGYGQNLAAYGATDDVAAIDPSTMLATSITNQWYDREIHSFLASCYNQPTPDMSNLET
jgi:hypothetical protein